MIRSLNGQFMVSHGRTRGHLKNKGES